MEVKGELKEYWLFENEETKEKLKNDLIKLRDEGYIFLAWNVLAEGHAFISLGINPTKCQWIDLQVEWKMLTNHNHKFQYGKIYVDGKVIKTEPPKYGEDKTVNNTKAKSNLAAGIYGLLKETIDTEHKDFIRNICIKGSPSQVTESRNKIMEYCSSDIVYLTRGLVKVNEELAEYFTYRSYKPSTDEMLFRGKSAARTALIQAYGYPLDLEATRKFADSVKDILKELAEDINDQLEVPIFKWKKREDRYGMHLAPIKEWIANSEYKDKWMRTAPTKTKPNGDYSLKLDAWEQHFSFRHEYKRGFLPAQVLRYLKTRRSLNGFLPKSENAKNKETIFDSIGSDGRCRAYLNPYGSQSARFQPKATSFIPLKAAWMRSLILPRPGRAIASIDYGSQEFLISAYLSNDKNMIEAYRSGDVYLYFAKLSGAVPWDGKKEDYKELRNLFKATTLGISYSMGPGALAKKLTMDTGKEVGVKEAQELISKFEKAFPDYANFVDDVRYTYEMENYWHLADGWIMFGDNDNKRSVSNLPVQGMGSCILRKAIELCQEEGLNVIYPLHDALYIEYNSSDTYNIDRFADCMRKAFGFYFKDSEAVAKDIRLDCDVWSPDYSNGVLTTPNGVKCKMQNKYIDERSINEYEKFKKYM